MNSHSTWFVAADGSAHNEGTRERPFHDPWVAFQRAAPGDTICIAGGIYFGRFDRSSWIIDCPKLTVLGGCSRDFTSRTPWKTPSVFGCYAGYEYVRENNLIVGGDSHTGLILDGLCFDAADRNVYTVKAGIQWFSNMSGPIASFNADDVVIRNCVFLNSANGGVELSGAGSRFENNLLMNMIGPAMLHLRSSSQLLERPIQVTHNSFCFVHDAGNPAGQGGDMSLGIRVFCPADISDNVFVSCGNSAISTMLSPARTSIERNQFFVTPHSLVESRALDGSGEIKENNLEELEDLGFKASAGNIVQDPLIKSLPSQWLDLYSRHLLSVYATPPRVAGNVLRATAQLPALDTPDLQKPEQKGALAPRLTVEDALSVSFGASAGCHAVLLESPSAAAAVTPPIVYQRIEWPTLAAPDAKLANMPVEIRVGLGAEQNANLLADAGPDLFMGLRIFEPGSDDNSIYVLVRRNTFATRQYREAVVYNRGLEVESTYYLRGTLRTDVTSSRQKATLMVESIIPAPCYSQPCPARPRGRDWFVRAGASGGDGSRERPFRDPFQALDKAEGGDTVHVAGGQYFGKLHSGRWNIAIRNLSLLGGYTADFTARDPWVNHTLFALDPEQKAKGRPEGTILFSQEASDGLIVDGFIFDGASWNSYKDQSLDQQNSPLAPLVSLRGLSSPIEVRNCVFLNASDGAVILDCPLAIFENNLVLNTSGDALTLRANGAGPALIENNTLLFSGDPTDRAGTGKSSSRGTLLQLTGRAEVILDSNVVGFADNFGIRTAVRQQNLTLRRNQLTANLFNHLSDTNFLWADGSNWQRRVENDSAITLEENRLEAPPLKIDSAFADAALARLVSLPSRIPSEAWRPIAASIGATLPAAEADTPTDSSAPKPAATVGASSLDDLLAKFKHIEANVAAATPKVATKPPYCPRYDCQSAMALFREESGTSAGARRRTLSVSFQAVEPATSIAYARINVPDLDANRGSFDNQAVELDVTQLRESSSNPSLFPPGTDKNDYGAYSVSAVQGETRTRVAIVVKADTQMSKLARASAPNDKLRIRGSAHVTGAVNGLSIVVDALELIQ